MFGGVKRVMGGATSYWAVDTKGCIASTPILAKTASQLQRKGRARRIGPNVVLVQTVFATVASEDDIRRMWAELGPAVCHEIPQGANWPYFSELILRIGESYRIGFPNFRSVVGSRPRTHHVVRECARRITYLAARDIAHQIKYPHARRPFAAPRAAKYESWCFHVMREQRGHEAIRQRWRAALVRHLTRTHQPPAVYRRALDIFDRLWELASPGGGGPKTRGARQSVPLIRSAVAQEFGRSIVRLVQAELAGQRGNPSLVRRCDAIIRLYGRGDKEHTLRVLRQAIARAVNELGLPSATAHRINQKAWQRCRALWRAAGYSFPESPGSAQSKRSTPQDAPAVGVLAGPQGPEKQVIVVLARPEGAPSLSEMDQQAVMGALADATESMGGWLQTCVAHGHAVIMTAMIPWTLPTRRYVHRLQAQSRAALPPYLARQLWSEYYYAVVGGPTSHGPGKGALSANRAAKSATLKATAEGYGGQGGTFCALQWEG